MPAGAPLVSVVLPFFNASRWLGEALSSLLSQDIDSFEIIAIDDGSTDGSANACAVDTARNASVRLLVNPSNIGIVASLNRGLDHAKGRFIARMDADDVCLPGRFRQQIEFLETTGMDLCGTWFTEFGQGIARTVRWPHTEAALRSAMMFQNTICHPTVMARREVFDRYRYREAYSLVEDYDLFARALADFRMANVPAPLLRYRRHRQQATQAKRSAMEALTRRVRLEVLNAEGIDATDEEQRLHNLIRAPASIRQVEDLDGIEAWLMKLLAFHEGSESRQVIASQWIRACIRAAPLGRTMFKRYRRSPLHSLGRASLATSADLAVLAATRLDYNSSTFAAFRRLGLSA